MMKNTSMLTKTCLFLALVMGLNSMAQTSENNAINDLKTFDNHSTFISLLKDANLDDVVAEKTPVTIFAPSNQAFKQLNPQTLEIVKSSKDALKRVVGYHILPGKWTPEAIQDKLEETGGKMKVKTISGRPMEFFVMNGQAYFFNLKGEKVKLPSSALEKDHSVLYNMDTVMTMPMRQN